MAEREEKRPRVDVEPQESHAENLMAPKLDADAAARGADEERQRLVDYKKRHEQTEKEVWERKKNEKRQRLEREEERRREEEMGSEERAWEERFWWKIAREEEEELEELARQNGTWVEPPEEREEREWEEMEARKAKAAGAETSTTELLSEQSEHAPITEKGQPE
jgi:hypothetical protein